MPKLKWPEALKKRWKVYDPTETSEYSAEDLSIISHLGVEL